jgi:sugar phosphate isomerase/epimerase
MNKVIRIGGRVGFDRIDQLEERFRAIDFPIELALPWNYRDMWTPMEKHLDHVIHFFKERDIEILTLHGTQGRLAEEDFLRWGKLTLKIAAELDVNCVTVHPENVKRYRDWHQRQAVEFISVMEGEKLFSIETFGGKNRLFRPMELVEAAIPMTLDAAHIHDRDLVLGILKQNHPNIKTLHLSAVSGKEQHLPIDDFCVSVVDTLVDLKWSGNVILEYLPWHHYRVREDIGALRDHLEKGIPIHPAPADDKFRNDPDRWGYNSDGSN